MGATGSAGATGTMGATGSAGATGSMGATGSTLECFVAGTRIATPQGERAVEDLAVGDTLLTVDGTATIAWIGSRRLDLASHPRPDQVRPVRIAAGAFGSNLPARDLRVSPGHGLFVRDGHGERLIPAGYLVNGTTVTQESVASVEYLHIECDRHEILLAEGLPAESYLDCGNRAEFANQPAPMILHPVFATLSHEAARAPFVVAGPPLQAVRERLAAQASEMRTAQPRLGRLRQRFGR